MSKSSYPRPVDRSCFTNARIVIGEIGRDVEIHYSDAEATPSDRLVTVDHLIRWSGELYVQCFCHWRSDTRTFHLPRIRKLTDHAMARSFNDAEDWFRCFIPDADAIFGRPQATPVTISDLNAPVRFSAGGWTYQGTIHSITTENGKPSKFGGEFWLIREGKPLTKSKCQAFEIPGVTFLTTSGKALRGKHRFLLGLCA